jgi:phenylacetate-CoA ligase
LVDDEIYYIHMKKNVIDAVRLGSIRHKKEYRELRRFTTKEDLLRFQEHRLDNLLLHAYENVPYYHRVFGEAGLFRDDVLDLSKFDCVPVLTRDLLTRFSDELISKDRNTRRWYYGSSGGSTGEPVRFIRDRRGLKWSASTEYYYYRDILGIDEPTAKKVLLWGSDRDINIGIKAQFFNWLNHRVFLNSFRMENNDIEQYINKINTYKPDLIRGYAGSLFDLCQYAQNKDITLHTPKILISAAETLHDNMRAIIESSFRTAAHSFYGSREAPCLAAECKKGSMHVFSFLHHLEVLTDDNQAARIGEEGKVAVTNLHNYVMPLIRYEIGDTAIQGDGTCPCGSMLPTLGKVTGRVVDHFMKENGTTVPAEFFIWLFVVACNIGVVKKYQVVQEDYNQIRILLVPHSNLTESFKEDIEGKIHKVMGNCDITWEFVDDIPKSPSGKYMQTKSLVHR